MADKDDFRVVGIEILVRAEDANEIVNELHELANPLAIMNLSSIERELEDKEWLMAEDEVPPELLNREYASIIGDDRNADAANDEQDDEW